MPQDPNDLDAILAAIDARTGASSPQPSQSSQSSRRKREPIDIDANVNKAVRREMMESIPGYQSALGFYRGFASGAEGLATGLATVVVEGGAKIDQMLGTDDEDNKATTEQHRKWIQDARKSVRGWISENMPTKSEEGPSFGEQVAEGVGQGVFTIASATHLVRGAGMVGAALPVAGMGAAQSFGDMYWNTKGAGATQEEAFSAALKAGAIGTSEAIPIARFLNRLGGGAATKHIIRALIQEGAEEAVQEMSQTYLEGQIAEAWFEEPSLAEIARTGGASFLTGFLLSAGTMAEQARSSGKFKAQPEEMEQGPPVPLAESEVGPEERTAADAYMRSVETMRAAAKHAEASTSPSFAVSNESEKQGEPARSARVVAPRSRAQRAADAAIRAMGAKPVWVLEGADAPTAAAQGNTIVLNADADGTATLRDAMAHELVHVLEKRDPAAFAELLTNLDAAAPGLLERAKAKHDALHEAALGEKSDPALSKSEAPAYAAEALGEVMDLASKDIDSLTRAAQGSPGLLPALWRTVTRALSRMQIDVPNRLEAATRALSASGKATGLAPQDTLRAAMAVQEGLKLLRASGSGTSKRVEARPNTSKPVETDDRWASGWKELVGDTTQREVADSLDQVRAMMTDFRERMGADVAKELVTGLEAVGEQAAKDSAAEVESFASRYKGDANAFNLAVEQSAKEQARKQADEFLAQFERRQMLPKGTLLPTERLRAQGDAMRATEGMRIGGMAATRETRGPTEDIRNTLTRPGERLSLTEPTPAQRRQALVEDVREPQPLSGQLSGQLPKELSRTAPSAAEQPNSPRVPASDEFATGIKNAEVEASYEAQGMTPPAHGERRPWDVVNEKAEKALRADPTRGARLAKSLVERPRAISDLDTFVLLRDRVRLFNEARYLQSMLDEAEAKGLDTHELAKRIGEVQDAIYQNDEADTLAGTKNAQALAARRAMMKQDHSLDAMKLAARVAKGGAALSAEEQAEIAVLNAKLAEAQARVDALEARLTEDAKRPDRPIRQAEQRAAQTSTASHVRTFIAGQAERARARIAERAKTERFFAGGFETQELLDYAIIGAEHIASGASAFSEWSKRMLGEFGDSIREQLPAIYEQSVAIGEAATNESGRLSGFKTRTRKAIERMSQKMAAGDFSGTPKRSEIAMDPEALKLKSDLEQVKREYAKRLDKFRADNRTRAQTVGAIGREILDLPKSLKASWDFSAVLRQGGFFSFGHPVQTVQHVRRMLSAMTERGAIELDVQIRNRKLYELGKRAGLELTDIDGPMTKREEMFISRLANKIPGIKATNRAYVAFLNLQRAARFDDMVRGIPGTPTIERTREIARFVNIATGRGDAGKMAGAVAAASHVLWAPKLLLSRAQLLAEPARQGYRMATGQGDAYVRKTFTKEYARSAAALGAIYALWAMFGGEEEKDPRSSDFGKLKTGNTRVDPLFGLAQIVVLGYRLASGEKKLADGSIVPIRGEVPYGGDDAYDVATKFVRSKLSPTLGIPINLAAGSDPVGQPYDLSDLPKEPFPLIFSDLAEAMQEQGMTKGAALGTLGILGAGLQTYTPRVKPPKAKPAQAPKSTNAPPATKRRTPQRI